MPPREKEKAVRVAKDNREVCTLSHMIYDFIFIIKFHEQVGIRDSEQWEALKQATRQKLEFSGWVDSVEEKCREYIDNQNEPGSVKHADIMSNVHDEAIKLVPDHIKAEVLQQIKLSLLSEQRQQCSGATKSEE